MLHSCALAFPGGSAVKNLPANAGDAGWMGLLPGLRRCPGVGNDIPLQYSCLENPMERGAWRATVHGVAKSWMGPSKQSSLPSLPDPGEEGLEEVLCAEGRGIASRTDSVGRHLLETLRNTGLGVQGWTFGTENGSRHQ